MASPCSPKATPYTWLLKTLCKPAGVIACRLGMTPGSITEFTGGMAVAGWDAFSATGPNLDSAERGVVDAEVCAWAVPCIHKVTHIESATADKPVRVALNIIVSTPRTAVQNLVRKKI